MTFFSSEVIGRDLSRTLLAVSVVAILLAPFMSGNMAGRLLLNYACLSFSSAEERTRD